MPKEVVVVFVHGINVTCQDYYEKLRDKILKQMPKYAREWVVFRAVFWADIVRGRQQEYLLYARTAAGLKPTSLHKLVIEGLGDAASYQKTYSEGNSAYYNIQERLKGTIRDAALDKNDARPLVFVGHSLGCHILSSFAWDVHKLKRPKGMLENDWENAIRFARTPTISKFMEHLDKEASPFERLDTLAGIVMMGSNMPLFTFTFGPQYVHPITRSASAEFEPAFPGPRVSEAIKKQARWLNFFSLNDPLGYPLKPLNDAYDEERRLFDTPVKSEGWLRAFFFRRWLRSLNALSAHTGYWRNRRIARETARMLHDIAFAEEIAAKKRKPRMNPLPREQNQESAAAAQKPPPPTAPA